LVKIIPTDHIIIVLDASTTALAKLFTLLVTLIPHILNRQIVITPKIQAANNDPSEPI